MGMDHKHSYRFCMEEEFFHMFTVAAMERV
jgi:hypothetical protein